MTESDLTIATSPTRTIDSEIWRGARASLPVLLGFIPFALVLGAQAAQKGLDVHQVALMTGLNFGGGSEFAAIELWSTPVQTLLIVAMTLLVNSRHLLMGAALAPYLQHLPTRKALTTLFFMCDESWAMGLADARENAAHAVFPAFSRAYFLGLSVCLWLTWLLFTSLGCAIGPVLGDIHAYGFDMAFAAVFLVLLRGMWKGFRAAQPWLISLVTAAIVHLMLPGGWYVLAGTLTGLTWAYLRAK